MRFADSARLKSFKQNGHMKVVSADFAFFDCGSSPPAGDANSRFTPRAPPAAAAAAVVEEEDAPDEAVEARGTVAVTTDMTRQTIAGVEKGPASLMPRCDARSCSGSMSDTRSNVRRRGPRPSFSSLLALQSPLSCALARSVDDVDGRCGGCSQWSDAMRSVEARELQNRRMTHAVGNDHDHTRM
jgi:hypothetical protein